MLVRSSDAGVRHAFIIEQVLQDKAPKSFMHFSHYTRLEHDSVLNQQPVQLHQHWCYVTMFTGACYQARCHRAVCDNGMLCKSALQYNRREITGVMTARFVASFVSAVIVTETSSRMICHRLMLAHVNSQIPYAARW